MTKFLVHGFTDSGSALWILAMKDAYLANVLIVLTLKIFEYSFLFYLKERL